MLPFLPPSLTNVHDCCLPWIERTLSHHQRESPNLLKKTSHRSTSVCALLASPWLLSTLCQAVHHKSDSAAVLPPAIASWLPNGYPKYTFQSHPNMIQNRPRGLLTTALFPSAPQDNQEKHTVYTTNSIRLLEQVDLIFLSSSSQTSFIRQLTPPAVLSRLLFQTIPYSGSIHRCSNALLQILDSYCLLLSSADHCR